MSKPNCKLGGKCPFQKSWFNQYGVDVCSDNCPKGKYKENHHKEKRNGEIVNVLDDKCIYLEKLN